MSSNPTDADLSLFLDDLARALSGFIGLDFSSTLEKKQELFRFERPKGDSGLEKLIQTKSSRGLAEISLLEEGESTYLSLDNVPPPYKDANVQTLDKSSEKNTKSPLVLYFGEFRLVCLTYLETLLLLLRATAWQLHVVHEFERKIQLPYFTQVPDEVVTTIISQILEDLKKHDYNGDNVVDEKDVADLKRAVQAILDAKTCQLLLAGFDELIPLLITAWNHLLKKTSPELIETLLDRDNDARRLNDALTDVTSILGNSRLPEMNDLAWFDFEVKERPDCVSIKWNEGLGSSFLQASMKVAEIYRNSPPPHAGKDRLAFHAAHYLLNQGQNPFDPYKSRFLGTVGFRETNWQTYLSLTDPGQGHVFGTTARAEWMKGAIVHVEHLERPNPSTQAQIESYRILSVLEFARVCFHTGYAAPNTCYVGRPLRDNGDFKLDFIKVVDTVSSACSSMFRLGATECKIGMSGGRPQSCSAAFNLNTPIIDDIKGIDVKDPVTIGIRAIELAALGGFDKVTWDGASDSYPSVPLLQAEDGKGLLSLKDALKLVHLAHSVGLTTYFSAGFKEQHIKYAVFSGEDGIGIGGAQVLRGMDKETGMHGEYQESRIERLIEERDRAAETIQGRAAVLLTRLDQMFFEGSINDAELIARNELFNELDLDDPNSKNIQDILDLDTLKELLAIPGDHEEPWKGRAKRLLQSRNDSPSLLEAYGDKHGVWKSFEESLKISIGSEGAIHSLSMSHQWKDLRKNYRLWVASTDSTLSKHFVGDIDVSLKTAPYGDSSSLVVSDLFAEKI